MMNPSPGQFQAGGYAPSPVTSRRTGKARRVWAIVLLIIGVLLLVGGVILTQIKVDGGTISQLNGLCTSGIGQIAQQFNGSAQIDCGKAGLADHAIGWVFGVSIVFLVLGVLLAVLGRRKSLPSPPAAQGGAPYGQHGAPYAQGGTPYGQQGGAPYGGQQGGTPYGQGGTPYGGQQGGTPYGQGGTPRGQQGGAPYGR